MRERCVYIRLNFIIVIHLMKYTQQCPHFNDTKAMSDSVKRMILVFFFDARLKSLNLGRSNIGFLVDEKVCFWNRDYIKPGLTFYGVK